MKDTKTHLNTWNYILNLWVEGSRHKIWKVKVLVTQSCVWIFETPWTAIHHTPQSVEFSKQDTEVGSHSLLKGIFLTQGWAQVSSIAGEFFTIWATREVLSNQTIDSIQFQSKSQKIPCMYVHMSSKRALDKQHISDMTSYQIFFFQYRRNKSLGGLFYTTQGTVTSWDKVFPGGVLF